MLKEGGLSLYVVPLEPGARGIVTQHNPIVSDSAVAAFACSSSQHGMVSMPGIPVIISMPAILQTCSLRTRTVPATTLPASRRITTRDEIRFSIPNLYKVKSAPSKCFLENHKWFQRSEGNAHAAPRLAIFPII